MTRFTPDDYKELVAVFKGTHPETGEELRVEHPAPEGFAWPEAPAEEDVFAPDYAPGEIAEIAQKLRRQAGFCDDVGTFTRNGGRSSGGDPLALETLSPLFPEAS